MSRKDCVSNRNTKIILTYVLSILGDLGNLLDGIEYLKDRYSNPESYFMDEDEWGTLDTYKEIYYRAKAMFNDPDFFFNCGVSSAKYHSWGSFRYFERAFGGLFGGSLVAYKRVPTFNENFNDTKDFSVLINPFKEKGKVKGTFMIKFHDDIKPEDDYCSCLLYTSPSPRDRS